MRRLLRSLFTSVLTALARGVLAKYRPTVIAVAGSVGKTLTREAIYQALRGSFLVWEAHHSLNSEIGVPLAIFGVRDRPTSPAGWLRAIWTGTRLRFRYRPYPELLVLELGEDHPGDIASLCALVQPRVGVVTAVGSAHLRQFKTTAAIAEEMAALLSALPEDGFAVLNADDPAVVALADRTAATVATVGFSREAEIRAQGAILLLPKKSVDALEIPIPPRLQSTVMLEGEKVDLTLRGFVAPHQVLSALAALAVGRSFGIPAADLLARLRTLNPFKGRMHYLNGLRGCAIIDDSYNASPAAVQAALTVVEKFPAVKRRIIVLGVMDEIGETSPREHRTIGAAVAGTADIFVAVAQPGKDYSSPAEDYRDGAREAGLDEDAIITVSDSRAAGEWLAEHVRPGDLVLIKGSQVARMERTVAAVLGDPEQASSLLVRQDAFWLRF